MSQRLRRTREVSSWPWIRELRLESTLVRLKDVGINDYLSFSASATVNKILDINDKMVATMAGGAADCQFWIRMVAKYCK
jgi:hypothetical protein